MAKSRKPRRAYTPKLIGRPVLAKMRDELVLPAYAALEVLRVSTDAEALDSAWNTLAALCNTASIAGGLADMPTHEAESGQQALREIAARHARTNRVRASGPELQALRDAVAWFDGASGAMRTDHIIRAIAHVDRALFSTKEARAC